MRTINTAALQHIGQVAHNTAEMANTDLDFYTAKVDSYRAALQDIAIQALTELSRDPNIKYQNIANKALKPLIGEA